MTHGLFLFLHHNKISTQKAKRNIYILSEHNPPHPFVGRSPVKEVVTLSKSISKPLSSIHCMKKNIRLWPELQLLKKYTFFWWPPFM